jgi:hypothetical protein
MGDWFEAARLVVEIAQVVLHEGDEQADESGRRERGVGESERARYCECRASHSVTSAAVGRTRTRRLQLGIH